jgi:hypothetical protein
VCPRTHTLCTRIIQVVIDQGYYAIGIRFVLKIVDPSFLGEAITATAHTMGDYVKLASEKNRND